MTPGKVTHTYRMNEYLEHRLKLYIKLEISTVFPYCLSCIHSLENILCSVWRKLAFRLDFLGESATGLVQTLTESKTWQSAFFFVCLRSGVLQDMLALLLTCEHFSLTFLCSNVWNSFFFFVNLFIYLFIYFVCRIHTVNTLGRMFAKTFAQYCGKLKQKTKMSQPILWSRVVSFDQVCGRYKYIFVNYFIM